MVKTVLITGSTDGIGFEAAKSLVALGHQVLLHGRNPQKLEKAQAELLALNNGLVATFLADLTDLSEVESLANRIQAAYPQLDVLINNAGVFRTDSPVLANGMDARFMVNSFAPYVLSHKLLPLMNSTGRVINLSSAAQASVDLQALCGQKHLEDAFEAYAQSKLALTMWSTYLAKHWAGQGPSMIAVNLGSLLATKMVKEGFGMAGNDIAIGARILVKAALSEEFAQANGRYFDNDKAAFTSPHADALEEQKILGLMDAMHHYLENSAK